MSYIYDRGTENGLRDREKKQRKRKKLSSASEVLYP
jgi:hypothetical protein